jgi:ribonuclease HII
VKIVTTMGIDEAGRGPAVGPMVMAAVCLDTRAAAALTRAGLRDSKAYGAGPEARAARAEMAVEVRRRALWAMVVVVDVCDIDRRVARGELNVLEREVADRMIQAGPAIDRIIADGATLFGALGARHPHLQARNGAEERHAAVAAASVLAKVRRDALYDRIAARYRHELGEIIGGGYVNDGTRRFLRAYAERHGRLPPEARRTWPHPYLRDILGEEGLQTSDLRPQAELFGSEPEA